MKLTFFLITFFLVLVSAYFASHQHGAGGDQGTMVISSGDDYVKIQWSGKIRFTDDEKGIQSISPGGYLKFRRNDARFAASANVKGEISYELYDGHEQLSGGDSAHAFITKSVSDMLACGFHAGERVDRIYKSGGDSALVAEAGKQTSDHLRIMLLERALKDKRLPADGLLNVAAQIERVQSDWDKAGLLKSLIGSGPMSDTLFGLVMEITGRLEPDMDRTQLYRQIIDHQNPTEKEWIVLIDAVSKTQAEYERAGLLAHLGHKMPKTDALRAAYTRAAGTLHQDPDYGRAMRGLQDTTR